MDNEDQINDNSSAQIQKHPDNVLDSTSGELSKVVSNLEVRKAKKQQMRDERIKKKKIRPLPSINVMKKRLFSFLVNGKKEKLNILSKYMSDPFKLNESYNQARDEDAKLSDFPKKSADEIKNLYFKYF